MALGFASALSEHPQAATAVGEVVGQVLDRVGPEPDLAALFVSGGHITSMEDIVATVRSLLGPRRLIGASAESLLAGPQEIEERAAVALFAGSLGVAGPDDDPGVEAVRLEALRTTEGWAVSGLPPSAGPERPVVLIADPFSFPADAFVDALGRERPGLRVLGGLASSARRPGENRLVLDGSVHEDGAVALVLPRGTRVRSVVSQGCRPVGDPMVVTRAEGNVLEELAGAPALSRLEQVLTHAEPVDRDLLSKGVHLGVVIDERREIFGRGDFLVRSVLGAEPGRGALVVGDRLDVGTTVQFHVRDAAAATEDLRLLLAGPPASAALVFTCNGRGSHLFGEPGHDAACVHEATGRGAVAGMFCAGEIGPVGDRNFLHGFTASVLLFEG